MSKTNLRLRWAHKVLRAKSFVVMTDKESVIALSGINPTSLSDIISLQEQAASIDNFMDMLKDLREEHSVAIEKIMEKSNRETSKNTKVPASRSKKIKVKEV